MLCFISSSPDLVAQLSFSERLLSVVVRPYAYLSVFLCSVFALPRKSGPVFTKVCTYHHWCEKDS